MRERIKAIVILGQTATGKSALAVKIARNLGGEIISADSRQVYKGLDIGTGKVTKTQMKGVPHHLLDVANPTRKFSVARFQKLANSAMADISSRGMIPIICGGTGFYIDSITKGIVFPKVPPDTSLRRKLEKKTLPQLLAMLGKLDKRRVKNIEQNNKVRLIRAIEVAKALGKVPAITQASPVYHFVKIGLYLPPDKLKKKIRKRLSQRMREGMIAEVEKLHQRGLSWKRMQGLGLEYKYVSLYLQSKLTKEEMLEKLNAEIYQYAKRQMTWFKRDKEVKWIDASDKKGIARQTRALLHL